MSAVSFGVFGRQVGVLVHGASNPLVYGPTPSENTTRVNVSLVVKYGYVTLPLRVPTAVLLKGTGYQDTFLVLSGSIQDVNLALSRIVYRSQLNWNSVHSINGFDVVTIVADDTGLSLPLIADADIVLV